MELGRVNHIKDIREIWMNEARDFTPWLAQNLELLGEELGYDFEIIKTEKEVGNYYLDILAKEVGTGNLVAIENQLEKTDHNHLGQLITYASGVDAKIAIWISKEICEEHRKAIDWLNENAGEDMQFFAIEVQAIRIGNSLPAPTFKIKASPNSWVKGHINPTDQTKNITETKQYYYRFFNNLLGKVKERLPNLTNSKSAGYDSWKTYPSGKSGYQYSTSFRSQNRISVELYIDTGEKAKNEEGFNLLLQNKKQIEEEVGELSWELLEGRRACRIAKYISTPNDEEERYEWFVDNLAKFVDVFSRLIDCL